MSIGKIFNAVQQLVNPPKPVEPPKPPPPPPQPVNNKDTVVGEFLQNGTTSKAALNAKFDAQTAKPPTLTEAAEQIKKLPVPNPSDATAVAAYNRQRADIADSAIQNAQPPKLEDFSSLNPATAAFEYGMAKTYHDSQVSQLQTISTAAKTNPTVLSRDVQLADTPRTPGEVSAEAFRMISDAGGKDNLDTKKIGEQLAVIAQTDPGKAWALAQVVLGNKVDTDGKGAIEDGDKDAVVQSMINKLSDDDLYRIGGTESGRALLQRSQEHMYAGSSHEDEKQVADRIQQQGLQNHTTLTDTYQGVSGFEHPGTAFDPNATPEQAARAIKSNTPMGMFDGDSHSVNAFVKQLEYHKGDAAWMQKFYSALGAEKVGSIMNAATRSTTYTGGMGGANPKYMLENTATIRQSLETMHAAGVLRPSDMNSLVKRIGDNPHVALEIFGKSNNSALQTDFVKSVVANGGDNTKAAVVTMLSRLPADQQSAALGALNQSELNSLFTGAMRAKGEILDLSSEMEFTSFSEPPKRVMLGDVTSLMQNAANNNFPAETKQKLFLAASTALADDKVNNNFKDNNALRDSLSRIFIDETKKPGAENLLVRLASAQNGRLDADERSALSGFFAYTVFSPNQGNQYSYPLAEQVKQVFLDAGKGLTDGNLTANNVTDLNKAQTEFKNKYGLDPKLYATMVGGLFKSAQDGLALTNKRYESDEASKKAAISFFVDMAASLVPGVSGIVAKGTTGVLEKVVSGPGGTVEGKVKSQLQEGAVDLLQKLFQASRNSSISTEELTALGNDLAETLPNQVNRSDGKVGIDLFDGFTVGYNGL